MNFAPHQQRVADEHRELCERLDKLRSFLTTETCYGLPFDERGRLVRQEKIMTEYVDVLCDRIAAFTDV